jgi:hypothetical protein
MQHLPIRVADPDEVVREAIPGDLAIFYSEHFERFRTAIRSLQQRNVATLYAIDGILEWRNAWENRADEPACPWTMRPILSHKVACIGDSQARTLSQWGNGDKVEVVGIPRLDHFERQEHSRLGSGKSFRLLVMTAKWPGFTQQQRQQITRSLIDLKNWAAKARTIGDRPIELVWRLTGGLDEIVGIQNELRDTTGEDLVAALHRADATITTPSTTQLESMLLGKPTAILDYSNSPRYVGAAWRVTAECQFTDTVRQLCEPTPERMHFQNSVLADALQCQVDATDRMLQLIDSMREISAGCSRRGEPLSFTRTLLPALSDAWPELCAETIFQERDETKLDDKSLLQVELADAKREIKLLRATIDQLNNELGQAHAIFDTIRQHPIAGPVVRTRERILGWVGKSNATKSDSN